MKEKIHPIYQKITVTCSCGNIFDTKSSLKQNKLNIEICNNCHPFYTGKLKIIDTEKRVDNFNKRYLKK